MKKNKKIIIMVIGILTVIALGFGVTYAWLTLTLNGTKNNVLKVGNLSLVLDDTNGEGILVEGALPMLDETGLAQDPYTFSLTNNGTLESGYAIYLDDLELETGEERVDDSKIKYSFVRDGETVNTALVSTLGEHPNRILETGKISPDTTYNYELRLWVDSEAGNEVMGKVFRGKIRVEASQAIQRISTQEECFAFSGGNISDFYCIEGNTKHLPVVTDVVIPSTIGGESVTSIEANAFNNKQLKSVSIPKSVNSIGTSAFASNPDLMMITNKTGNSFNWQEIIGGSSEATFETGVAPTTNGSILITNGKSTDESCFTFDSSTGTITKYDDTCPKDVVIPSKIGGVEVTSIGLKAFYQQQLTSTIIPDTVLDIDNQAFQNNQLINITLPNRLNSIGSNAFSSNQLRKIIIPDSVTTIKVAAFQTNQLTNVTIPSSVTSIGPRAFNNNQLPDEQAFIYARNDDGSEDKTMVVSYGGLKTGNVVIPNGVISIGENAFQNATLTSITIPNTVKSIGNFAFYRNQLTSIIIPDSVTSIGNFAFDQNKLKSVVIPSNVISIQLQAFSNNQLTNVVISNGVENIGVNAFSYNQLTSVTIPDSVTSIDYDAFANNQLTSVVIKGKANADAFTSYPLRTPFGWASGYSDSNIKWNG